jgi:hypothetical protein
MKIMKIAMLGLAVLLYTSIAVAQHGHGAGATGSGIGMGNGAGNGMGHDAASGTHGNSQAGMGNANSGSMASAHGKTAADILSKNTALADKISKLTHESATDACAGFKNLGQCVAAAHVAKNLGLTFDCLKSDMLGTAPAQGVTCPSGTGTAKSMSLGKAIQTLDPDANKKAESKKGQSQAKADLKESNS